MSGPSNSNRKKDTVVKLENSCIVREVDQLAESFDAPLMLHDESKVSLKTLGKRKASPYACPSPSKLSTSKRIRKESSSPVHQGTAATGRASAGALKDDGTHGHIVTTASHTHDAMENKSCTDKLAEGAVNHDSAPRESTSDDSQPQSRDALANMPLEIFHCIAMLLSPKSIFRLSHTCAAYRAGLDDAFLRQYVLNNLIDEYTLSVSDHEDDLHLCFKHQHARVIGKDLDIQKPQTLRKWFCQLTQAYCYHCDMHTYRINEHTGRSLCEEHMEDPQYETIGVTRVKNEFLLTEDDLASLSYATALNPIFYAAPRQRLYLLNQIKEIANQKHGDQLQDKLAKRFSARALRKEAREQKESLREAELRAALAKLGLQMQRGKYTKCHEYIKKGKETLASVVDAVQEDHLLYVHTNYSQLLRVTRTELFERISVLSCSGDGPFSRTGIREAHEASMAQRAKVLLEETEVKFASLARTQIMCLCGRAYLKDEIPVEPYEVGQSAPPLPAEAKPLSVTERQAEIAAYNLSMAMFDSEADIYNLYDSFGELGEGLGLYDPL